MLSAGACCRKSIWIPVCWSWTALHALPVISRRGWTLSEREDLLSVFHWRVVKDKAEFDTAHFLGLLLSLIASVVSLRHIWPAEFTSSNKGQPRGEEKVCPATKILCAEGLWCSKIYRLWFHFVCRTFQHHQTVFIHVFNSALTCPQQLAVKWRTLFFSIKKTIPLPLFFSFPHSFGLILVLWKCSLLRRFLKYYIRDTRDFSERHSYRLSKSKQLAHQPAIFYLVSLCMLNGHWCCRCYFYRTELMRSCLLSSVISVGSVKQTCRVCPSVLM